MIRRPWKCLGAARHHRANPAAGLRLEQVYGFPVLLSGLGSLVLDKSELSVVNQHHKETISCASFPILPSLYSIFWQEACLEKHLST